MLQGYCVLEKEPVKPSRVKVKSRARMAEDATPSAVIALGLRSNEIPLDFEREPSKPYLAA